jgi:tryptophan synthase beta chain
MVARFQSVISQEIKTQLLEKKEQKTWLCHCLRWWRSNAAGTYYHFLDDEDVKIIAVEAAGLGVDSGESAATSVLGK